MLGSVQRWKVTLLPLTDFYSIYTVLQVLHLAFTGDTPQEIRPWYVAYIVTTTSISRVEWHYRLYCIVRVFIHLADLVYISG